MSVAGPQGMTNAEPAPRPPLANADDDPNEAERTSIISWTGHASGASRAGSAASLRPAVAADKARNCSACGARFHMLCNPRQTCDCGASVCASCAPTTGAFTGYCEACQKDPRTEFKRLSAVLEKYPLDSDVWAAVADEMDPEFSLVRVGGKTFTQAMCYGRAIELRAGHRHWTALARSLPAGGHIDLNLKDKGTYRLSKNDCYANALYLHPRDARIWTNLASDMSPSQIIEIEGFMFNQLSAILHALELSDGECAPAWSLLGVALHGMRHKNDIYVHGERHTILDCFERSLELLPHRAATWNNLANILPATPYWLNKEERESFLTNNPSMMPGSFADSQRHHHMNMDSRTSSLRYGEPCNSAMDAFNDRGANHQMRPYVKLKGRKYGKLDCALLAYRYSPKDCRVRFNLACAVCPDHPIHLDGRLKTKEDIFRDVLEQCNNLRSINMRCLLKMLFPKHPRLLEVERRFAFDETKPLGNGAYGSVFEATEVDYVTGEVKENLAAKVIDNFGVEAQARNMLSSVEEVRALIDVRFSRQHIVQCKHVLVDTDKDRLVLFLERALGSLADRVKGKLDYDDVRRSYTKMRQPITLTEEQQSALNLNRQSSSVMSAQRSASSAPLTQAPVSAFFIAQTGGRFEYRLHESEIRYCAMRVLECLEEMHQLGATHQDIKPDNVLVFDTGLIKLGDLGSVAQTRGGKRKPGGTDPYLAPEALREIADVSYLQAQRSKEVAQPTIVSRTTVKRDVWSWAALVVHLASGRVPIKTAPVLYDRGAGTFHVDFAEGYQPMLSAEAGVPHIPATLSRELRNLLRTCFCPNSADRPAVHELLTTPYFVRSALPPDAETKALFEHRKEQAKARAFAAMMAPAADERSLDAEWGMLYRDLPLYGPQADINNDPSTPLTRSPSRLMGTARSSTPTFGPAEGETQPDGPHNAVMPRRASGLLPPPMASGLTRSPSGLMLVSSGPSGVRPLPNDVLLRMRNVAEGTFDMTT
jgi:serine/threonine protein kinase